MPTLVVIAYGDETSAATAGEQAQRLARYLEIGSDAIAVARRDGHGRFHLTTNHRPAAGEVSWGIVWMLVFALLFDRPSPDRRHETDAGTDDGIDAGSHPGTGGRSDDSTDDGTAPLLGMIAGSGVDEAFRVRVRDRLTPGTSALFLALGVARPDRAVEMLGQYGGELLQTTMTPAGLAALREALHGRPDRLAGTVSAGRVRAPGSG
jgi:uncharacterized membrane protein